VFITGVLRARHCLADPATLRKREEMAQKTANRGGCGAPWLSGPFRDHPREQQLEQSVAHLEMDETASMDKKEPP
jgi:hypothetical protein